jgi:hypothetical protein
MRFTQPIRKLALLAHVLSSVAWVGAVAVFLVLAVTGLGSSDRLVVRAVYIAMKPVTGGIIVPLALASFFTGLLLSFGTNWGLFRHYWVIFKLLISLGSLPLLLLHTRIIDRVAAAALSGLHPADFYSDRVQLVVASGASLLVLVLASFFSIFKPRGPTGWV